MLHFPSTPSTATFQLNATQTRKGHSAGKGSLDAKEREEEVFFLRIEEELHDARRVQTHGQEDDLRAALGMVLGRVSEVTSLLRTAMHKAAELQVQLDVAQSNLKMVIANNEMLEDALKVQGRPGGVGWNRGRGNSVDDEQIQSMPSSPGPSTMNAGTSRFMRFRFGGSGGAGSRSAETLSSSSMPSLHTPDSSQDLEAARQQQQEELTSLRTAHANAIADKHALENELENLSQALFEEANRMVAVERRRRADVEDEMREVKEEKEALLRALKVIREEEEAKTRERDSVELDKKAVQEETQLDQDEPEQIHPEPLPEPSPPTPPPLTSAPKSLTFLEDEPSPWS